MEQQSPEEPLFHTKSLTFWIKVYSDRVEFKSAGRTKEYSAPADR